MNNCTPIVSEFLYSFNHALKKFEDEPHIKVFSDILFSKIDASIKTRHDSVIALVKSELTALAVAMEKEGSDQINSKVIVNKIQQLFPVKTAEEIEQLEKHLSEYETNRVVLEGNNHPLGIFEDLFLQDVSGRRSIFLRMLIEQEDSAKERFIEEIKEGLSGYEEISTFDANQLISQLDPPAKETIKLALRAGFHASSYAEVKKFDGVISVEKFLEGLKNSGIYKTGGRLG